MEDPTFSSFMAAISRQQVNATPTDSPQVVPNLVDKFTEETNKWVEKTSGELEQKKQNFLHSTNQAILMGVSIVAFFVISILVMLKVCETKGRGVLAAFLFTLLLAIIQFIFFWTTKKSNN